MLKTASKAIADNIPLSIDRKKLESIKKSIAATRERQTLAIQAQLDEFTRKALELDRAARVRLAALAEESRKRILRKK